MSPFRSVCLRLRTALTKLAKWLAPPPNLLDQLVLEIEGDAARIARHDDVSFGAVEDHADRRAAECVASSVRALRRRALAVRIIVDANLRVCRFAGIFVAQAAAVAHHAGPDVVDAQAPARHIHLVDALVAQVAVAVIPHPVPVVMQALARQRFDLGRVRTTGRSRPTWEASSCPSGRSSRDACSTAREPA